MTSHPRSIPAVMTWELLHAAPWTMAAGALAAVVFPVILLGALAHEGALHAESASSSGTPAADEGMINMHIVLVQFNVLAFGAAIAGSQWNLRRLYASPATTANLATWRLAPAMFLMFLESATCSTLVNSLYSLDWPVWGPAFYSAVLLAAAMAAFWFAERSAWIAISFLATCTPLGLWFRARYGAFQGSTLHLWESVTPGEGFALLAFLAIAWVIAVAGIARNRAGEPPWSTGMRKRIERWLESWQISGSRFRSVHQAQQWYVWRSRGILAPALTAFGLAEAAIVWLAVSRTADDAIQGLVIGGFGLGIAGIAGGLAIGDVSSARANGVMASFLATRPIATAQLAQSMLRSLIRSLLTAWLLWAGTLAVVYATMMLAGVVPGSGAPPDVTEWHWGLYWIGTLLGPWILMSNLATMMFTGRTKMFGKLISAILVFILGTKVLALFALNDSARGILEDAIWALAGTAAICCALVAFTKARQRGLISSATFFGGLGAWVCAIGISALTAPHPTNAHSVIVWIVVIGGLGMAVLPLATTPLALEWNRRR